MAEPPIRSRAERIRDTRALLESEIDCWVASASPEAGPHLVPLSFAWHDERITLATARRNRAARNMVETPEVRIALGGTRDVVLIEGTAEVGDLEAASDATVAEYAAQTDWDPREWPGMAFVEVTPQRVMAWREENEVPGRVLMEEGRWLED